jgi:hypothetical protein
MVSKRVVRLEFQKAGLKVVMKVVSKVVSKVEMMV